MKHNRSELVPISAPRVYHLKITHIKGTVIRGEREGVFDELLRIYAVDLITGQKFDNILMKKSYSQLFGTSLLTIEKLIELSGNQVDCHLKPQLGYVRSLELKKPIYVETRLTYIPKNGAYRNKKGELVPYRTTDVYRVNAVMRQDDKSIERMFEQYRNQWLSAKTLYAEITGKNWNHQTAGAEEDQILMNIIKVYKIIQRTATKQELVQLKGLLNDLIKD